MDPARETWELENAVRLTDPNRDALYNYSSDEQKAINNAHPWRSDPHHFKHVRISAVALLKMVMHARSGGSIEVMGLMQGYIQHETFIVTDALRLPVEGTETRVNAQDEANEYMINYLQRSRDAGQLENAVGWYHSHPGYGCWLSGIDVNTQSTQQTFQDPFVAVVIDPDRTISAGKVEIGAFRTYPENYKPDAGRSSAVGNDMAIRSDKAADFGAHADRYYPLEVSHFKSTLENTLLEAMWNKYWVQTLSSSPLFTNRDYSTAQIADLATKVEQIKNNAQNRSSMGIGMRLEGGAGMDKVVKAAEKIANEEKTGLMAAVVKEKVFGVSPGAAAAPTASAAVPVNGAEDVPMEVQEVKEG
ncbi:COP9 signalosome catalytic subunit rri1 [Taxawa tesnikishii (nom. ined.)]|nr:COP9 signalosome catalytic subunit rri1 [Dothideales sp. JES 119]